MPKTLPQSVSVSRSSPLSKMQVLPRMTFVRAALMFSHTLLTARTACRQLVREPVEGGFVARRHDQNGADIAVLCAAQEDMAQQSPAARLIVGAHAGAPSAAR